LRARDSGIAVKGGRITIDPGDDTASCYFLRETNDFQIGRFCTVNQGKIADVEKSSIKCPVSVSSFCEYGTEF